VRDEKGGVHRATLSVPAQPRSRLTVPGTFPSAPQSVTLDPDVALLARLEVHSNR